MGHFCVPASKGKMRGFLNIWFGLSMKTTSPTWKTVFRGNFICTTSPLQFKSAHKVARRSRSVSSQHALPQEKYSAVYNKGSRWTKDLKLLNRHTIKLCCRVIFVVPAIDLRAFALSYIHSPFFKFTYLFFVFWDRVLLSRYVTQTWTQAWTCDPSAWAS